MIRNLFAILMLTPLPLQHCSLRRIPSHGELDGHVYVKNTLVWFAPDATVCASLAEMPYTAILGEKKLYKDKPLPKHTWQLASERDAKLSAKFSSETDGIKFVEAQLCSSN